jgi:hypothetical protein
MIIEFDIELHLDVQCDMAYKFERFTGSVPRGDTKIAINKSGLIRLSSGFCRVTNILNHEFAILFYDKINKAIAIKFTNNKEQGILKLTKDRNAATISAKSFLSVNSLLLRSNFGRFAWEKQTIPNIGEVFIIELNKK